MGCIKLQILDEQYKSTELKVSYSKKKLTSTFEIKKRVVTDHLGSTRVIVDNAGNIKEQNDYYPFGKKHENASLISSVNRYRFNGMEFMEAFGIDMYDSHFRWYDPDIVVTPTQDPKAEKFPWQSPYVWCNNNPVNIIDPDGREGIVVSGGEYDDKNRYKYNFIEPAITRLKELVAAGGSEPITWAVVAAGYSKKGSVLKSMLL